ncbi:hypothetical protein [Duganella sp. HH101]|nr:hypothetical protein [Duganella sp. HH101]OFA06200.1 hypothetical protein DUGA2_07350 [Duganella sp. HH101]
MKSVMGVNGKKIVLSERPFRTIEAGMKYGLRLLPNFPEERAKSGRE